MTAIQRLCAFAVYEINISKIRLSSRGQVQLLHIGAEHFIRLLALSWNALAQRMMELRGPGGAVLHTAAAEPAFIGIQHQRRLAAFRVRDEYVHAAYIHAAVAAGTQRRVKGNGRAGPQGIEYSDSFLEHPRFLLLYRHALRRYHPKSRFSQKMT